MARMNRIRAAKKVTVSAVNSVRRALWNPRSMEERSVLPWWTSSFTRSKKTM